MVKNINKEREKGSRIKREKTNSKNTLRRVLDFNTLRRILVTVDIDAPERERWMPRGEIPPRELQI